MTLRTHDDVGDETLCRANAARRGDRGLGWYDTMSDPVFPQDITDDEAAVGFKRRPVGATCTGETVFAVVQERKTGLRFVKTRRHDGTIEYAIWDRMNNVPIYVRRLRRMLRSPSALRRH